jgi:hypothetical protein
MKLNDIDFNLLNDNEIKQLCIKYKLIKTQTELNNIKRAEMLKLLKFFMLIKMKNYGIRRKSISGSLEKNSIKTLSNNSPPKAYLNNRRLSEPITRIEKVQTSNDHEKQEIKNNVNNNTLNDIKHNNYDSLGMYPPVVRLVCIGDLHGDLTVTLKVLKLAEVIPMNSTCKDIDNIHWIGGNTWVIQLGDQIDRCRPDDWVQNCIKDFDDVDEDEGSNMKIIKLFLRLNDEAAKCGGRVLGLLGNHELMNIDRDFRYVSPQEFLEFVPMQDRKTKYTEDGYPLGYWHRTKAYERGSNISKMYAYKKKSVITIGSNLFVHGGLSRDLVDKYSISVMNSVVTNWLLKKETSMEEKIFDEIFRDDDDMSPFWCRLYSEEDGEGENTETNFNDLINKINRKNKTIVPIKRIVLAHTPQFMESKYLNGIYNNRLWRIDVGMSRAFGKHNTCGENKYRKPQILIINNDKEFETRMIDFNSERYPSTNMGERIDINNLNMPF